MEIFTYLKANIRYKKGAFFRILLLMAIISCGITVVASIVSNCEGSMKEAYKDADSGEILVLISDRMYTQDLKSKLQDHTLVKKVKDKRCVSVNGGDLKLRKNHSQYQNSVFLTELDNDVKLIREDGSGYLEDTAPLNKGEIYVPKGMLTNLDGQVGDVLDVETIGGRHSFTVKGIALEPMMGSFTIGYKQIYISKEDFKQMLMEVKEAETKERTADIHSLMIYQKGDGLSAAKFRRRLNLDTGITDQGIGSLTRDMSMNFSGLVVKIGAGILVAFILLLTAIVLIAMGHSISSGIEMDYVNLGILKSYGFSQGRIRLVYVLQYMLTQAFGVALGVAVAVFLCRGLGGAFWPITAVVAKNRIHLAQSLLALGMILAASGIFIFIVTAKIGKISPVRAIAGGRREIYFDSRLKAPIFPKALLPSLAFRQILSGKRRHGAAFFAAAILCFLMITMELFSGLLVSETAVRSMGVPYGDCHVEFLVDAEKAQDKAEQEIESVSKIERVCFYDQTYVSIEGEEMMCIVYRDPKQFEVLKGRAPIYENETAITEILAEDLEIGIGDTVVTGHRGNKQNSLVTGIIQSTSDAGMCFGISEAGAKKLGIKDLRQAYYSLKEPDKGKQAVDALNKRHGDILKAKYEDSGTAGDTYQALFNAVRAVIWCFSLLFAFVVVQMVCEKAYLQERTDIGIYKAVGFGVPALRIQFAFRFFFVAAAGAAVGIALAALFANPVLSVILRNVGMTNPKTEVTVASALFYGIALSVCFFAFAYLASARIRRVSVRELVME